MIFFQAVLLGPVSGKSEILRRLEGKDYSGKLLVTIGVDLARLSKTNPCLLWDAGAKDPRWLVNTFKNASLIFLVISAGTFFRKDPRKELDIYNDIADEHMAESEYKTKVLIISQIDTINIDNNNTDLKKEAKALAGTLNCKECFYVSAKTGEGIDLLKEYLKDREKEFRLDHGDDTDYRVSSNFGSIN